MAGAASQARDADSSRTPGLTSGLQGSVNVHRGALLFSYIVFYFVETERTGHNNTDSVSSVEKMCLQYPNLPKGEFFIKYHKTNKIHMKHKVKLLLTVTTRSLILVCYIPPFI